MSQEKEGKLISLAERRPKPPEQLKKKLCPCMISAFGLLIILAATFLFGVCIILNVLWWHEVDWFIYIAIFEVLAVYGVIFYIGKKGIESKPHHSDCLHSFTPNIKE